MLFLNEKMKKDRNIVKAIAIFFSAIVLQSGCVSLRTFTLYKTEDKVNIHRLGVVNIASADKIEKEYPRAPDVFRRTLIPIFRNNGFDQINYFNEEIDYSNPETDSIKAFCSKYNLDAVIITKLQFMHSKSTHVNVQAAYVRSIEYDNVEVEMKIFYKNGDLAYAVRRKTSGNNSAFSAIQRGTKDAAKRLTQLLEENEGYQSGQ